MKARVRQGVLTTLICLAGLEVIFAFLAYVLAEISTRIVWERVLQDFLTGSAVILAVSIVVGLVGAWRRKLGLYLTGGLLGAVVLGLVIIFELAGRHLIG